MPRYQTIEVEYRDRTGGEYGDGISHFLISWLKLTGLIIAIKIMLEFLGLNKELEPIIDNPSGNSIKKIFGNVSQEWRSFFST